MKMTLKREVAMDRWRVIGTFGFAQKRPEIVAVLALAEEQPDGVLTGLDVAQKLLADRPGLVGERLLAVCFMMRLVERVEHPKDGWVLTDLGRSALKNEEVPAPQRGEFDVWLLGDLLHREVIVRVRPTEQEHAPRNGERVAPCASEATQDIPHRLKRSQGTIVRPPLRGEGEANEVFVFDFMPQGRFVDREPCELLVELGAGGAANFEAMMEGRRSSFAPAAKLPTLAEALKMSGRSEADGPVKVGFRTLSDEERRSARRVVVVDGLTIPDLGEFPHVRLSDVPMIPATQQDADEWAVWRLVDGIQGYVWPQDYERRVRTVREFAVKEGWQFDPALPTQEELAQRLEDRPSLARRLLVPLDWQVNSPPSVPVLMLSGRAADSVHSERFVQERGAGASRVYLLTAAESKTTDDGLIGKVGKHAVPRRVRMPDDVWLRTGADGWFGQRWFPAPNSDQKPKGGKIVTQARQAGEWRDLSGPELVQVFNGLRSAFWSRPTHELLPDGKWVAVKPTNLS